MLDERAAERLPRRARDGGGAVRACRLQVRRRRGRRRDAVAARGGRLREFDAADARPPRRASRAFADGGYYVMRDGWTRESNYLLLDCGPARLAELRARARRRALVRAGRARADAARRPRHVHLHGLAELRDYFRGIRSAQHARPSTASRPRCPTGLSPGSTWHRRRHAHGSSTRDSDYFEGRHDGYERLARPATHTRRVLFIRDGYCVIHDGVETAGTHRYALHFHFAHGCRPVLELKADAAAVRERPADGPGLEIHVFGRGGLWREEEGWVSPCYRERSAAPVFSFTAEGAGAQEFITFLVPRRAGDEKTCVREIEAEHGRAFEILDAGARDVLIVGGGGRTARAAGVVSDFDLTWARFAHGSHRVRRIRVARRAHPILRRYGGSPHPACCRHRGGAQLVPGSCFRRRAEGGRRVARGHRFG